MELTEAQKKIIMAPESKIAVQACAASAKAQPNYTIIPTPEGYKQLGAIKVGDYVFDRYGKPTKVLGVYPQGQKQIYKITFQDGTITECADEHLWSYDNGHGGLTTHTTEEIIKIGWQSKDNRGHNRYKIKIPNLINPVEYTTKEYKIHPYVIGCFLGDGCCTEKYLTMSSADKEVIDEICSLTGFQSYRRSQYNYSWDFYNNGNKIKTQDFFQKYSKEIIGYSYEKVMPEEYLFGDVEQRLELLRGLMDTDGYIGNGRNSPKFSTTSPGLKDGFLSLVRSLGFYATVSVCLQKDNHREKYEISFFTGKNNVHQIVKLPRKKKVALTFITEQEQHINHKYKSIYNIEKTDKFTDMTCIYVDNQEHLYLTNDYIITHNTTTLIEKVRKLLHDGEDPNQIAVITFTRMAAAELIQRLGDDYQDGLFIGTIHSLAASFLTQSGYGALVGNTAKQNDFDKFFTLCEKYHAYHSFKWLCLDEAQDTGELELKFIFEMIKPECYFVVYDLRQCQPKGTKITLYDGTEKNIEDIEIGDKLITYSKTKSFQGGKVHNAKNYQVLKTEHHFCNEPLIKITLENGKSSIYSPEHICIVNLTNIQENYLVYLMCDENNRFRVGKSQFTCSGNNNVYREKMIAEECKKIWILKTFKTDKEARVYEDKVSYKYQIPQITFQLDKTTYTKEDIAFIYEGLDTYQSAKKCLEDHHRKIEYPFCFVGDNNHYASNAYNQCYACNILPNNMNALCFNPEDKYRRRKEPSKIVKVEYVKPQEVYSLEVEGNHNYVADGILTHNCIYGFNGARPELLVEYIKNATHYILNENFRNGYNILNYAKWIIGRTNMNDNSVNRYPRSGQVLNEPYDLDDLEYLIKNNGEYKDWAILGRYNATVDKFTKDLQSRGIPVATFKQGDLTPEDLDKLMKDNTVKVLTAHSSKGLAWKYVATYGMMWTDSEEIRLNYVAATRAKELLWWMKAPVRKKIKSKTQSSKKLHTFGE